MDPVTAAVQAVALAASVIPFDPQALNIVDEDAYEEAAFADQRHHVDVIGPDRDVKIALDTFDPCVS